MTISPDTQSEGAPLVPIEERSVEFYGDTITGALVQIGEEPQVYVPLRPICEYLGLSWAGQRERVMRDDVLADVVRSVRLSPPVGGGGGTQELLCLPLDYLPGWLFGVS